MSQVADELFAISQRHDIKVIDKDVLKNLISLVIAMFEKKKTKKGTFFSPKKITKDDCPLLKKRTEALLDAVSRIADQRLVGMKNDVSMLWSGICDGKYPRTWFKTLERIIVTYVDYMR